MKRLSFIQRSLVLLFLSLSWMAQGQITSKSALRSYVTNSDSSFKWELRDSILLDHVVAYQLKLTSQTWRKIPWIHELTIFIPTNLNHKEALLFVTGGSVQDDSIRFIKKDIYVDYLSDIALKNKAVTAVLRQVPRQPLYNNLDEDALISYTFHQFQSDKDYTWPLLLPMTKSAVRSMDAIQQFTSSHTKKNVTKFVVSGASKRGWTTWLTAASGDKRVKAIAPMVIDILNMPVSVRYQQEMFGGYSIQIQDYVQLGLTETANRPDGKELLDMVDPYSYRKQLKMPKMLILATNDEYWTADAVKNYIGAIPGKNYISYVHNIGHSMGDKSISFNTLNAFFAHTIKGGKYPRCDYKLKETDGKIKLEMHATASLLEDVVVWEGESDSKDFRQSVFHQKSLGISGKKKFEVTVDYPSADKFKAFHVALKYKSPTGGSYYQSTRVFVSNAHKVFPVLQ
ncbi:MAG: PhoPQ-activated protein PqaA family protein [Bacteroidales bacterium]|nr:PhoPQ-activated protein PqaA family protein [Bacteroidales bacterium]